MADKRGASKTVTIAELRAQQQAAGAATDAGTDEPSPEPAPIDPNLFPIPDDASFGSGEVADAPELARIARDFIQSDNDFDWLNGKRISWYWVRKGGSAGGTRTLGNTVKPHKLWKKATPAVMVCWLAADTLRDLRVKRVDVEALVYERLCAIGRDESGKIRRQAEDFKGYKAAVKRFGAYTVALQQAAEALGVKPEYVRNARLFEDPPEDGAVVENPDGASSEPVPAAAEG